MVPPAQRLITKTLRAKGLIAPRITSFGNLFALVSMVDADQINFRQVSHTDYEKATDPLDDLYAALGAFEIMCAIEADVVPLGTPGKGQMQHRVDIKRVGFYVKDKFDFNEDQPLGFWNFETGDVSRNPLSVATGYH